MKSIKIHVSIYSFSEIEVFSELTSAVYEHFRTSIMCFFFLLYCVHCGDVLVSVVVFVCLSVCLFVWIFKYCILSVFVTNKGIGYNLSAELDLVKSVK